MFVCNKKKEGQGRRNCMKCSIFKIFNGQFHQRSRFAMSADSLCCIITFPTALPFRKDVLTIATDLLLKYPDGSATRCLHQRTSSLLLCLTRDGWGTSFSPSTAFRHTWAQVSAMHLENCAVSKCPTPLHLRQETSAGSVHYRGRHFSYEHIIKCESFLLEAYFTVQKKHYF